MATIKKETYRISRRNRECRQCGGIIKKGERYACNMG
jgi:ribosomal protein S27AE